MHPKTFLIKSKTFGTAWALSVYTAMRFGKILPAESEPNSPLTRDIDLEVELTGDALQQILDAQIHPLYPQKHGVSEYRNQFNPMSDDCKKSLDPESGFDYTYYQRLCLHGEKRIDQIEKMAENLQPYNRRLQAITWEVPLDLCALKSTPCLQRVHVRQLSSGTYEVVFDWRSRDIYKAFQMNLVGLLYFVDSRINEARAKFGMEPLKCVKLVDKTDCAHIYEEDWNAALRVPVSAQSLNDCVFG